MSTKKIVPANLSTIFFVDKHSNECKPLILRFIKEKVLGECSKNLCSNFYNSLTTITSISN